MRFRIFLRNFFLLILVSALFAGMAFAITFNDRQRLNEIAYGNNTRVVETAIRLALNDATRAVEATKPQFRYIVVEEGKPLIDVAAEYNTTIDVLRMANRLLPTVDAGSGVQLIIPQNVQVLSPPRTYRPVYVAGGGETLEQIAEQYSIPIEILREDNPVLAGRGIIAGDLVFIAQLI
jgi:LysM repeat protein